MPTLPSANVHRARVVGSALAAVALVASLLAVVTGAAPAAAQVPEQVDNPVLVVDSTGDGSDASGADGVCATSGGDCTLRAAIEQANYNPGSDRIEFGIAGGGTKRIALGSELPSINDSRGGLTIDGYTQNGASPNTATTGFNGQIRVEVEGSGPMVMFLVQSAENTIRGLAIYGGDYPIELRGEAADGNVVAGNLIGTNVSATSLWSGLTGVYMNLGPDRNRIGTPDLADRNVFAGLAAHGIRLNHGETSQNRIQNNIIGLSPDGTDDMGGSIGIDIQWWSWGNLVGGTGPNEANVISGNNSGIDISHKATGNLALNNLVGTTLDGNSANDVTRNGRGIIIKDDPVANYFGGNIVAGAENDYAIWHKHNYTGGNSFVGNRIGVSANGNDIGSSDRGMILRGHDDVYHGNIFANIDGPENIVVVDNSIRDGGNVEPDEQTVRNAVRVGTYYRNDDWKPIEWGSDGNPHPNEDTPRITGLGPGQVNGDRTCANCEVEVYVSGSVNADGTLSPGTGTTGLTWIGTVYADGGGDWSMASPLITAGSLVSVAGITPSGESSNFSNRSTVPSQGVGLVANPDQPVTVDPPAMPSMPPLYERESFDCSFDDGVLSWDDVGAPEYYVFANTGGTERYLGGHSATSLTVPDADSYRVEHWTRGIATNATCDGDGPDQPSSFNCSFDNGTLTWDDVGAPEYYVFANTGGTERYLGGHSATSLTVPDADSYRVEHWITGQVTNATCDGDGPDQPSSFNCSFDNGTLTWDDVGAPEYYVFATVAADGGETYLGGHSATSLTVPDADSYRVEHWITGQVTNATCDGGGGPTPFACTVSNGVLSWDDVGAPEYYVFANTGGTERYLGGHSATSLTVPDADSYRVEHWITGQVTNAICGR